MQGSKKLQAKSKDPKRTKNCEKQKIQKFWRIEKAYKKNYEGNTMEEWGSEKMW